MVGMESATESRVAPQRRAEEILERSAAFYESVLWESEVGRRTRERLVGHGLEESTLLRFRVGYAPGSTELLRERLGEREYDEDELIAAGIGTRSDRERLHLLFHARVMFPIRDADDRVLGFAGLATHLGPSWPLWLTSPDCDPFRTSAAIFAIGEAKPAIARAQRALVLRDPVQVLALHQGGRRDAVAVIQSPITREHLSQLADALGGSRDLHLARRDGRLGVVAVPDVADVADDAFAERSIPAGFSFINSRRRGARGAPPTVADVEDGDERPPATRAIVYIVGGLVGVGIPIGALLIAEAQNDGATGPTEALNLVIVGVAGAYAVLTLIVGRISARVRAQSTERRMRLPWVRGSDEVQPAGWTYHRVEEILVGAALISAITCVVLLMTVGGFLG
jgi:hypothetical protein